MLQLNGSLLVVVTKEEITLARPQPQKEDNRAPAQKSAAQSRTMEPVAGRAAKANIPKAKHILAVA
jgi:hypothetical protein